MAAQLFHYYLGLDLGQARDYSAIALIEEPIWIDPKWSDSVPVVHEQTGWVSPADLEPEQAERASYLAYRRGRPAHPVLSVRHLERFELGTRYPAVIERVRELIHTPALKGKSTAGLVDKTGVGAAVIDSFVQSGLTPMAITIHGGSGVSPDPQRSGYRVPKRDLVSAVQVLLQNERLKIPKGLALAETLKKELLNFRVKIDPKTAHDSYEHWREGDHDDLVLATAMACWYRQWWNQHVDAACAREQARKVGTW
jgi:hypothetical protein